MAKDPASVLVALPALPRQQRRRACHRQALVFLVAEARFGHYFRGIDLIQPNDARNRPIAAPRVLTKADIGNFSKQSYYELPNLGDDWVVCAQVSDAPMRILGQKQAFELAAGGRRWGLTSEDWLPSGAGFTRDAFEAALEVVADEIARRRRPSPAADPV